MNDLIIVIGPKYYADPFQKLGNTTQDLKMLLKSPNNVSLVVFTGGEDIHPTLYGGMDRWQLCTTNLKRDILERRVFNYCAKYGIKMTGICRGFQLLNVMAGGFMYHHIERHVLEGLHRVYFAHSNMVMNVTSTHHQLVGLPKDAYPIAWAEPRRSALYVGPSGELDNVPDREIEAAVFPEINAMGVQYHPEVMWDTYKGRKHYVQMIKDFIALSMQDFMGIYTRKGLRNGRNRKRVSSIGREAGGSRS